MLAIDLPTLQQDVTDKESIVSCITGDPIVGDPIVDEYILSGRYDPNEYNLEIDRVFFHLFY